MLSVSSAAARWSKQNVIFKNESVYKYVIIWLVSPHLYAFLFGLFNTPENSFLRNYFIMFQMYQTVVARSVHSSCCYYTHMGQILLSYFGCILHIGN
jgi:hypothetical protein